MGHRRGLVMLGAPLGATGWMLGLDWVDRLARVLLLNCHIVVGMPTRRFAGVLERRWSGREGGKLHMG